MSESTPASHTPNSSAVNSSECPYCGDPIKEGAIKCRQCQTPLMLDLSTNARVGRPYPYRDIRIDTRLYRLLQLVAIMFSVGAGIALFAFGHDLWSARTETQRNADMVRDIRVSVESSLKEIEALARQAEAERGAAGQIIEDLVAQVNDEIVQVNESVSTRLAEIGRRANRVAIAPDPSGIALSQPVSHNKSLPTTVFGDSITFEWSYPGVKIGGDSFQLQVARTPQFETPVIDVEVYKDSLTLENAKTESRSRPFAGVFYWRVRLVTQDDSGAESAGQWTAPGLFATYGSSLDRIKLTKKLRVGTSAFNGSPTDSIYLKGDGDSRQLAGMDHDVIQAVVKKLVDDDELPEVALEFYNFSWQEMFEALADDRVDLIISGITRTPQRAATYNIVFCEPYYETPLAAVWRKDSGIQHPEDLVGRSLLAIKGQRGFQMASLFTSPDRISSPPTSNYVLLFTELMKNRNREAAAIMDLPMARMAEDPRFRGVFVISHLASTTVPPTVSRKWMSDNDGHFLESWSFAVSADDVTFPSKLSAAVNKLKSEGVFAELAVRHGFPPSASE